MKSSSNNSHRGYFPSTQYLRFVYVFPRFLTHANSREDRDARLSFLHIADLR